MHPIILKALNISADADHELNVKAGTGVIYVTLAPKTSTTDEVYAEIAFSFEYERDYYHEDVYYDEGYRVVDVVSCDEITKVYHIKWSVNEVEGGSWTPSDADKVIINELIENFVFEYGDEQLEPYEPDYDHDCEYF